MKFLIGIMLIVYTNIAVGQIRCVKWTWYNAGGTQKIVCLQWDHR